MRNGNQHSPSSLNHYSMLRFAYVNLTELLMVIMLGFAMQFDSAMLQPNQSQDDLLQSFTSVTWFMLSGDLWMTETHFNKGDVGFLWRIILIIMNEWKGFVGIDIPTNPYRDITYHKKLIDSCPLQIPDVFWSEKLKTEERSMAHCPLITLKRQANWRRREYQSNETIEFMPFSQKNYIEFTTSG